MDDENQPTIEQIADRVMAGFNQAVKATTSEEYHRHADYTRKNLLALIRLAIKEESYGVGEYNG